MTEVQRCPEYGGPASTWTCVLPSGHDGAHEWSGSAWSGGRIFDPIEITDSQKDPAVRAATESAGDDTTYLDEMERWLTANNYQVQFVRIRRRWWQRLLRRPALRSDLTSGRFPNALPQIRERFAVDEPTPAQRTRFRFGASPIDPPDDEA